MSNKPQSAADFADVAAAAQRLRGHARLTPLLEATELSDRYGARIAVKWENLQIAGAFNFRGAYNRLSRALPAGAAESWLIEVAPYPLVATRRGASPSASPARSLIPPEVASEAWQ